MLFYNKAWASKGFDRDSEAGGGESYGDAVKFQN